MQLKAFQVEGETRPRTNHNSFLFHMTSYTMLKSVSGNYNNLKHNAKRTDQSERCKDFRFGICMTQLLFKDWKLKSR